MKKLEKLHYAGVRLVSPRKDDVEEVIDRNARILDRTIVAVQEIIGLINSHSEAIEELKNNQVTAVMETPDMMKIFWKDKHIVLKNPEPTDDKPVDKSESIAKAFHNTYERLAPSFGYSTRKSSAVPWEEVPDNNKALMIATVREVMNSSLPEPDDTHRTVTLRIPKDMTIGRTIIEVMGSSQSSVLSKSDTDLQAEIDKIGE